MLRTAYATGVRRTEVVKKSAYHALGFSILMTLEQAKECAKQLNGENTVKRQDANAVAAIATRLDRDQLHHSVFIPEALNQQFLDWLDANTGDKNLPKLHIYWNTSKKILIALKLAPDRFADNRKQVYRYLANQAYSYSYSEKLIWIMNLYGTFVSKITGKFFEKIPAPQNHEREMINDAYHDSDSYLGPSEPLSPELLKSMESKFSEAQYRWLHCSVWFGLRPSELDMIVADRQRKFWRVEEGEVEVLWVYQPKLTALPRPKRWKPIPMLFDEQKAALDFIFKGELDKPLTKTVKKHTGQHCTLYAGRKGFTDLMLERGQRLEDIAQWLGHSSIEMTWTHYKNKKKASWTKVG